MEGGVEREGLVSWGGEGMAGGVRETGCKVEVVRVWREEGIGGGS